MGIWIRCAGRLFWAALGAALFLLPAFAAERVTVPLGDSPSRGPVTAPVTMVEFVDFQ